MRGKQSARPYRFQRPQTTFVFAHRTSFYKHVKARLVRALAPHWRGGRAELKRQLRRLLHARRRDVRLLSGLLRAAAAPAMLAAALFAGYAQPAQAGICEIAFAQQTGAANPVGGIDLGDENFVPNLVDLDGDGDLDIIVSGGYEITQPGGVSTAFAYLKNVGNAVAPSFVFQGAASNPLNFSEFTVFTNFRSAVADFDDDGDYDAIFTYFAPFKASDPYLQHFAYFENTGSRTSPAFTRQSGAANPFDGILLTNNAMPSPADLDGDGDVDVFYGETLLENTGTPGAPVFVKQPAASSPLNGLGINADKRSAFLDTDKDGDLDMVVGAGNSLRYFENTGTFENAVFAERTGADNPFNGESFLGNAAPTVGDLNNDGLPELIVGTNDVILSYVENQSVQVLPTYTQQPGAVPAIPFVLYNDLLSRCLSVVDIDGDDDLDLFTGFDDGSPFKTALSGDRILYFENTGDISTPNFVLRDDSANNPLALAAGNVNAPRPQLADLDGDLDFDAVIGQSDGTIEYYRNNGSPIAPSFGSATNPFAAINVASNATPCLFDLDSDGDLDLVVGGDSGHFSYYENTGDKFTPAFTQRIGIENPFDGLDAGDMVAPTLVDWDGDGDADLISGRYYVGDTIFYAENVGSPKAPGFVVRTGSGTPFNQFAGSGRSGPAFADIDNDGDMDFFSAESNTSGGSGSGKIELYLASGGTCPPIAHCQDITVNLDTSGTATILASDIDDGSSADAGIVSLDLDVDTFTCADLGPNSVTLTVTDGNSDTATCTATVTVQDVTPPGITLNGDAVVTLQCGEAYTEPGATAADACDSALPPVTIGGDTVDSGAPGDYFVTYDVMDASGNAAAQKTRTVTVLDNCDSLQVSADEVSITAAPGDRVEMGVAIIDPRGSIANIQWVYDSGAKAAQPLSDGGNISGAGTDTLVLDPVAIEDAGSYACQVTDQVGTVQSGAISLSVTAALSLLGGFGMALTAGLLTLLGAAFTLRRRSQEQS